MESIKMPEMKPHASIDAKRNPFKGKSVGENVSTSISGKLVRMSEDEQGYHCDIELKGMSKEDFEKMTPGEQEAQMKREVEEKA